MVSMTCLLVVDQRVNVAVAGEGQVALARSIAPGHLQRDRLRVTRARKGARDRCFCRAQTSLLLVATKNTLVEPLPPCFTGQPGMQTRAGWVVCRYWQSPRKTKALYNG